MGGRNDVGVDLNMQCHVLVQAAVVVVDGEHERGRALDNLRRNLQPISIHDRYRGLIQHMAIATMVIVRVVTVSVASIQANRNAAFT